MVKRADDVSRLKVSIEKIIQYLAGVVGGFSAAFLMYVAIGSLLGLVLSKPVSFGNLQKCWPLSDPNFYTFSEDGCESILSKSLLHWAVHMPRHFISAPAIALYGLKSPHEEYEQRTEEIGVTYVMSYSWIYTNASVLVLLGLIGFLAWQQQSPLVAWSLYTLVLSQIAFIYFHLAFYTAA
jgi:hypothetical protein